VKILESDREPSKNEWNKLFKTPGYKVLLATEFSRSFFENSFRLVFKPSEKNNLEEALKSGKNRTHLNHYIKVRDNKNKIREQQKNIRNY
ncbi:MAG: hypothetical protein CR986_03935, partial [Ignavibacteriae bacterium]